MKILLLTLLLQLNTSPGTLAIKDVSLIPMNIETVVEHQTVIIKDGVIVDIGNKDDVKIPVNATIIDGSGKYIVPGISEMHAHIPPNTNDIEYMEEVLFLYLANGITTVRGMLGHPLHLELREKAQKGQILSPRIFTSGPSINGNSAPNPDTVEKMVRDQYAAGYDFLKLHPGITLPTFNKLVEVADELDMPYAGHVSDFVGLPRTFQSNQKSIDHLDGYIPLIIDDEKKESGNPILFFGFNLITRVDESKIAEAVNRTVESGIWNVPTQSLIEHLLGPDSVEELAARPEMKYVSQQQIKQWSDSKKNYQNHSAFTPEIGIEFIRIRRLLIGEMNRQGAGILLGSDAPQIFNVPGFAIHHEMRMLNESGLTIFQVIKAGTVNVAAYFNEVDYAGTIETGKRADLVILSDNPLTDIEKMKSIEAVIYGGRLIEKDDITKRLRQIEAKYHNN